MIKLIFNELKYEYDVRGLIGAFFPGMEIEVEDGSCRDKVAEVESTGAHVDADANVDADAHADADANVDTDAEVGLEADITMEINYSDAGVGVKCSAGALQQEDFAAPDETTTEKNQLKRMVYLMFSRIVGGEEKPWGTLTGIRPIKLPMSMIEEGHSDEEVARKLKSEYLISDEKCDLSIQIAHKERALLDQLDYEDGYSLYIGIPFCPTTCLYCSFTSYPYDKWASRMDEYLDAVEKELEFVKMHFQGKKLNTIYFGGGTPTTLSAEHLDRILGKVTDSFDLSHLKEWTVEGGRPDSITPEKLAAIRRYPVDRISINPQTMKQETLDLIGRRHTVEQVKEAFWMARDAGMDNINMDLIIGLPQEREEDVRRTMEEIQALNPDNLTVHTLAIKRASRLNIDRDKYGDLYLERDTERMMEITAQGAAAMGMDPYYLYRQKNMSGNLENVGYARPGKEGIYNILIMEEKQSIVALGAGSVSKLVVPQEHGALINRASNVKNIEQYLDRVDEMIARKEALYQM